MPLRTLPLLLCAPIPVGHRVEVRFYKGSKRGHLGTVEPDVRPLEPLVLDLDSGIRYGGHWLFSSAGVDHHVVNVNSDGIRADLEVVEIVTGRVRGCQVVTVNSTGLSVETLLVVETEAAAYR